MSCEEKLMNEQDNVSFFLIRLPINLFTGLLYMVFLTSCTPFKIDQYKECHKDKDCLASFERCDLYNFCVNEGSLCYWHLSDGSQTYQHEPESDEIVIGLLADHDLVSQSGQAWPAIVGLKTGMAMTQVNGMPKSTILVCEPDIESRDIVLETFSQYGVKTIIGERAESLIELEEPVYISIGLNKNKDEQVTSSLQFTLGSSNTAVDQAFEVLSSMLLSELNKNEVGFISMLALKLNNPKYTQEFIERIIWRLSPYQMSVFRTLIVSFESLFIIDDVIIDFLNNVSPLQYFVTLDPLSSTQLSELIDIAQRKTTTSSTSMPQM